MKDFSNAGANVELPQQTNNGGGVKRESNVDYKAFGEKQLELLGSEGKHQFIGVITNAYILGTQEQDEQTIPVDSQDYANHEWRLEKYDDGNPKDPTAKIEQRWYKKKQQDCLVYTPQPVMQCALAIDLPEVMFPYGDFFEGSESAPFRIIHGKEGFITKSKAEKAGTRNLVAKPFNLKHVNVNRGKDGVEAHFALAKNGKLVKIADFANVLDSNGNFHAQDLGKLIGKAVNVEVEVENKTWDGGSRLEINVDVTSRLGPRDVPFYESDLLPLMKDEYFGFVTFNGENDPDTLKKINSAVVNTMKLSPDFESSDLAKQLADVRASYSQQQQPSSQEKPDTSDKKNPEKKPVENASKPVDSLPEPDIDFDDMIPF